MWWHSLVDAWWVNILPTASLWFFALYRKPVNRVWYGLLAVVFALANILVAGWVSYGISVALSLSVFTILLFLQQITPRTLLAWTTAGFGLTLYPGWTGILLGVLLAAGKAAWVLRTKGATHYQYMLFETVTALGVLPSSPGKLLEPQPSRLPLPDQHATETTPRIPLLLYLAVGTTTMLAVSGFIHTI